jgi:hypothetical protein
MKYNMHKCFGSPIPIVMCDKFGTFQGSRNKTETDHIKSVPYASTEASCMHKYVRALTWLL